MHVNEREILEAALLGYQSQVSDLQNKMREIVARLSPEPVIVPIANHRPRRTFSAETRAAMSAAAKKRWAYSRERGFPLK